MTVLKPHSPPTVIPVLLGAGTHQVSTRFESNVETGHAEHLPPTLARAGTKRRTEFLAGRRCAVQALQQAGANATIDIGVGADRGPVWPMGWVGSITHSGNHAAAVVARRDDYAGLGIDSELVMSDGAAREIMGHTLTAAEHAAFLGTNTSLTGWREAEIITLIFSAKESVYKCLRPLVGEFFDFQAAELTSIDTQTSSFQFKLTQDLGNGFNKGWSGEGRFQRANGWVHTAVGKTGAP